MRVQDSRLFFGANDVIDGALSRRTQHQTTFRTHYLYFLDWVQQMPSINVDVLGPSVWSFQTMW